MDRVTNRDFQWHERLYARGPIFSADLRKYFFSYRLTNSEQIRQANPRGEGACYRGVSHASNPSDETPARLKVFGAPSYADTVWCKTTKFVMVTCFCSSTRGGRAGPSFPNFWGRPWTHFHGLYLPRVPARGIRPPASIWAGAPQARPLLPSFRRLCLDLDLDTDHHQSLIFVLRLKSRYTGARQ